MPNNHSAATHSRFFAPSATADLEQELKVHLKKCLAEKINHYKEITEDFVMRPCKTVRYAGTAKDVCSFIPPISLGDSSTAHADLDIAKAVSTITDEKTQLAIMAKKYQAQKTLAILFDFQDIPHEKWKDKIAGLTKADILSKAKDTVAPIASYLARNLSKELNQLTHAGIIKLAKCAIGRGINYLISNEADAEELDPSQKMLKGLAHQEGFKLLEIKNGVIHFVTVDHILKPFRDFLKEDDTQAKIPDFRPTQSP